MSDTIETSPRFVYLGGPMEAYEAGPDEVLDVFRLSNGDGVGHASQFVRKVRIRLPGGEPVVTSLEWPQPGTSRPVEIAPAVLEALDQADPDEDDNVLRALRSEVEGFLRGRASQCVPKSA